MTDTNLIYLYQHNKDDILKNYNINPINLYSYDKHINFKKSSSSKIIGGVDNNDISRLFSSSHIRNISPIEATKINDFINHFFHLLNRRPSSRTKIGFIYSFQFNSISYFIEFSVKQNDKLIISVNLNPDFSNELIHISCFFNSFIHISFFLSSSKYRLYYKHNPNKNNKLNDILSLILDCDDKIFNNFSNIPLSFWNTDWLLIIRDNHPLFHQNLIILLQAIRFIISLNY